MMRSEASDENVLADETLESLLYNPTLSKSRMSTAICARFAASATRVKSFKKTSVEAALVGAGTGGTILLLGDCCVEDMAEDCVLVEADRGSIFVATVG